VPARRAGVLRRIAIDLGAAALFALSAAAHALRFGRRAPPEQLTRALAAMAPLRSFNSYGLFSVMTLERPEIAVEGSDDGVRFEEYVFRYKPGDPRKPPRWVAPHMPRLDWQMWFAAMQPPPTWFGRLLMRLLEGSPDVLALFDRVPFSDHPPRYVRAVLYRYRMTDLATRRATGEVWQRELLGLYFPVVTLSRSARERAAHAA
jgi:hypothetical protein